jgi:hypothetical protein
VPALCIFSIIFAYLHSGQILGGLATVSRRIFSWIHGSLIGTYRIAHCSFNTGETKPLQLLGKTNALRHSPNPIATAIYNFKDDFRVGSKIPARQNVFIAFLEPDGLYSFSKWTKYSYHSISSTSHLRATLLKQLTTFPYIVHVPVPKWTAVPATSIPQTWRNIT